MTQGAEVKFDLGAFFFHSQSIMGSTLGTLDDLAQVIHVVARGRVKPVIDKVYPLSEIRAAHERLADTGRFGQVVVDMG